MYIYCLCRQGEQFRPICVFELNTNKEKRQTYTGLNNPFHEIPEKGGKGYTDILIWGKFYTSIFFPPCCNSGGNFNLGRFFRGEILYGGIFYATTPAYASYTNELREETVLNDTQLCVIVHYMNPSNKIWSKLEEF